MEKYLVAGNELELRYRSTSKEDAMDLFRKSIAIFKYEIIASVAMINGDFRQEVFFKNNVLTSSQTLIKKTLYTENLLVMHNKFRLSVAMEEDTQRKEMPTLVRLKWRYRCTINESWYCDFTFVREIKNVIIGDIRKARIEFFEMMAIEPLDGERLEIELECRKIEEFKIGMVHEIVAEVFSVKSSRSVFGKFAQLMGESEDMTLKKILPNAIELSRHTFKQDLWPRIQKGEFAIVDKADGIRMILYANKEKIVLVTSDAEIQVEGTWTHKESLFECEYVDGGIYIYDIIMLDGNSVLGLPFRRRWTPDFDISGLKNAHFKKYSFLDAESYSDTVKEVLEGKYPYETDGVIFSSVDRPYSGMLHYKWKPIDHMSIDFYCKRAASKGGGVKKMAFSKRAGVVEKKEQSNLYYLFCSISIADFKNLGLKHIQDYNSLIGRTSGTLIPVHFCPSSQPLAYKFMCDQDIDDKIVEFGYSEGTNFVGHKVPQLKLMRVRDDRADDLKKGYFGNYFKIAELIWNNFWDPLTAEMLIRPQTSFLDSYFQKDSEEWKLIRSHNNNVKRTLIAKYASSAEWVLDLACGKGQDLLKYRDSGVKNAIMVDSIADNISQVISRKYDIAKKTTRPLSIYTFCIDLLQDSSTTFEEISTNGVPYMKVNFIACNLAIHYLIHDKSQMINTVKMFAKFTVAGTRIMITSLDGAKVFELLKDGDFKSAKFSIRKLWKENKMAATGQRISIKLPFAEEEMEETLVNYKTISQEFKKYKINMIDSGSFGDSHTPGLSDEEKKYISLHTWVIYEKS